MESSDDKAYMQRALQLANGGLGSVSPNPLVGCVIVAGGKIIGEGFHQVFGGPHAEVNAVNAVEDKKRLEGANVYVTLEPCSHHGKTPPCAELLASLNVGRVVIATNDPNPMVNGSGVAKLMAAGINVEVGLLRDEAQKQNKRFFTYHNQRRPYVILKWAQTKDGFIARSDHSSKWISDSGSRQLVHKWRTEEDAILVGKSTAHYDNPQLTARDWAGKNPLRIVIDRKRSLDPDLNLFTDNIKTIVYTLSASGKQGNVECVKLPENDFLTNLLYDLYERQVQSLIVEGGSFTINRFISQKLWDEARVFISEAEFIDGIKAPSLNSNTFSETKILKDRLLFYSNTLINGRA